MKLNESIIKKLNESDIYDIAEEYEDFDPNLIISDGQIAHLVLLDVQDYDKNVDPEVFRSVIDDCCNFAAKKGKEIEDYIYKRVKETNYCQVGGKNDKHK